MNSDNKWQRVLKSRKIWIGVIVAGVLTWLYYVGEINATQYASMVTIAAGILTGSISLEDGLSALLSGLAGSSGAIESDAPAEANDNEDAV